MRKLLLLFCLLGLQGLLAGCASSCPPTCLGENMGAIDWNGRRLQSAELVRSVARQANLERVDFSNADLSGANLSHSSLVGANFTNAQLIGADLRGTLLSGAIFDNTNLSGALFSKANLVGVELTYADLSAADFSEANLVNANLSGLNLAGTNFIHAKMAGVNLDRANLTGAQMSKVDLSGTSLRDADLRGGWVNLSSLVSADLRSANLSGVSLIGSDLTGARLTGALLVGANLVGANLRGADLRGADLRHTLLVATPMLVARENMVDSVLKAMSETQWKKLALGNTILDGASYNSQTRFPEGFNPPDSMIFLPFSEAVSADTEANPSRYKQLRLAGSSNVAMILTPLTRKFMANRPLIAFNSTLTDSSDGIFQLGMGQVDIAMSSLVLSATEQARFPELRAYPIANDSIVVVVNWNNPISNLSVEQLRGIYSGEIQNWKTLGGPDLEIEPLLYPSTLSEVFQSFVMPGQPFSNRTLNLPSNAAVRAQAAVTDGAVGLLPGYLVDASVRPLALNGIPLTSETVQNRQYLLIRPYYLLVRGTPDADMQELLRFIGSDEGKRIIRREGLEP